MRFPGLRFLLLGLALASTCAGIRAETVKDREGAVRGDRAAMENDARWIYNDWQRGFEEARRTGKPLLVVLRCVPCLACAGIDARVLDPANGLGDLLDRFVCVRVINANALDLARFQFDYDLSFSTLFFNGDGTVYGRYGSWRHQKDPLDRSTAGYRQALEGALELHRGYPQNRERLAGKQGGKVPFRSPTQIPGLEGRYTPALDWTNKVVASCVHCHQVGDAFRDLHRKRQETLTAELIYPWPAPETLGLSLAADDPTRVESVGTGSPAAAAGLRPGDRIELFGGQPPLSVADFSWVLHRAPPEGSVAVRVLRDGHASDLSVTLASGWRNGADISRRVGTWGMRAMALGGLQLVDLTDDERTARGLSRDALALRALHVGEYGEHAAAKKAGFRKDDVLVEIDGKSERLSESAWIGRILQQRRPGESLPATVLRGGERLKLTLPVQ